MKQLASRAVLFAFVMSLLALPMRAQDLASFEKRVTVKKLPNGLTLLVVERKESPTFSFLTYVNAGSAQDPQGESGLAHMFEHMAFKGTDTIGTTNYPAEKIALEKVEKAYAAYRDAREQHIGRDPNKIAELEKAWKDAIAQADKYVIKNQFPQIVEENGGVGMNAGTSEDATQYFYSMPVNRLQLWAYLESQRFLHPVMRDFYKERDVVIEERRMRTDSQPIGRLVEQFVAQAFIAHHYHIPGVGWMSDLNYFSATDAKEFFDKYYIPSNMVVALVGDVNTAQVMPMLEKYFGQLPARTKPDDNTTQEPPQNSERRVVLKEQTQPFYIEGYHRPAFSDPDDAVYDVISDILSNGRVSRLYRSLVRDRQIAAAAAGFGGFPGVKYPHLFAFYAVPTPGHNPQELETAIHDEINRLKTSDVSDEELKMAKTRSRADLIRSLGNNEGLAQELGAAQALYGDWRQLFLQIDRIDKVTKEDVRRVANKTFTPENRTVGVIENASASAPAKGAQQ